MSVEWHQRQNKASNKTMGSGMPRNHSNMPPPSPMTGTPQVMTNIRGLAYLLVRPTGREQVRHGCSDSGAVRLVPLLSCCTPAVCWRPRPRRLPGAPEAQG